MLLLHANRLVLVSTLLSQAYSAFGSALAPIIQPRATVCNGQSAFCERSYGNVTYVGAHDSYAVGATNILGTNQDQTVTQQLNDGIRLLQMQALNQNGTIELCHTTCQLYDGGSLQSYLTTVKTWLDANPNEVLSLLIVNIDDLGPSAFADVFTAVGLVNVSYAPPNAVTVAADWPTLGSMIDSGQRLVTFLANGADTTVVPYLIDEFTNIWESPFDVTTSFDCSINRTKGDPSTEMYLINHFLDTVVLGQPSPNIDALDQTNAVSGTNSLGTQVNLCLAAQGRPPNFLLVDFYEFGGGSVFEVAATINGVTYSPTSPIATPVPTSSSSVTSTPLNGVSFLDHNQRFACVVSVVAVMIGMRLVL
jgi:hypothetical protein